MVKPCKGLCLAQTQDSALSQLFGWLVGVVVVDGQVTSPIV
jgi:hypothetical protein